MLDLLGRELGIFRQQERRNGLLLRSEKLLGFHFDMWGDFGAWWTGTDNQKLPFAAAALSADHAAR